MEQQAQRRNAENQDTADCGERGRRPASPGRTGWSDLVHAHSLMAGAQELSTVG
jgi:hypothetical protein